MIHANGDGDRHWDRGWNEHKVRQLVRLARMPFSEKLEWLEYAHALAEAIRPLSNAKPLNMLNPPSGGEDR